MKTCYKVILLASTVRVYAALIPLKERVGGVTLSKVTNKSGISNIYIIILAVLGECAVTGHTICNILNKLSLFIEFHFLFFKIASIYKIELHKSVKANFPPNLDQTE